MKSVSDHAQFCVTKVLISNLCILSSTVCKFIYVAWPIIKAILLKNCHIIMCGYTSLHVLTLCFNVVGYFSFSTYECELLP